MQKNQHLISGMMREDVLETKWLEVLVGKIEHNKLLYKREMR